MSEITVRPLPEGYIPEPNLGHLPAGRYFVSDPGYLFTAEDQAWSDIVDEMSASSNDLHDDVSGALVNGHPLLAVSTQYGDGGYNDSTKTHNFSVDSGCIAAMPEALVKELQDGGLQLEEDLGAWVQLEGDPVKLFLNRATGELTMGSLVILTE